ncbi:phage head-tail connector protein [Anaplasma bovis]
MLENFVFHIIRRDASGKEFPVTLEEVKSFLGINNNKENDLLLSLIAICSEYAQWYIEKSLIKQTWAISYTADNMPQKINLPFGPLIGVLLVKYGKDSDEQLSIVPANRYRVDILQSSITLLDVLDGTKIEITYRSGYETTEHIPVQIKYGILHHVAVCYKNRDLTGKECLSFLKEVYLPFKDVKLIL